MVASQEKFSRMFGYDLRGRGDYEGTYLDWEYFLDWHFPNFEGNKQNAAKLLEAFSQGVRFVKSIAERLNSSPVCYPPFYVLVDKNGRFQEGAKIFSKDGEIFFAQSTLERRSKMEFDEKVEIKNKYDELVFTGTLRDDFILLGIQEAHHAYFAGDPDELNLLDGQETPLSEYDAQDHEYYALLCQLAYAQEQGMPQHTLEILQNRIKAAEEIRIPK